MARNTRTGLLLLASLALLAPACTSDGHLTLLGYTTRPNYDTNIRTVYMPIFGNRTFYRGMEFELHKAIQNALHTRTPYRITSNRAEADTELVGQITSFTRTQMLINPNNSPRAEEAALTVSLTWKDLRSGEILSRRQRRPGEPVPLDLPGPGGPALPGVLAPGSPAFPSPVIQDSLEPSTVGPAIEARPAPAAPPSAPVVIVSTATFHPELGESITTAQQRSFQQMATQITNMMQSPW